MTNKCHKWQSVTKTNKIYLSKKAYFIFKCSLPFAYYVPPKNILIDLIIFILIHHILLYIIWWYDSIQTDHQLLGGCRLPVLVYCAMSGLTNARFCSDPVPGSYLNVKDFSQVLCTGALLRPAFCGHLEDIWIKIQDLIVFFLVLPCCSHWMRMDRHGFKLT